MKKYIVISANGFTEDDDCNQVENCQVIGIYSAESAEMAASYARMELVENGWYFKSLTVYRLVTNANVLVTHGTFSEV